MIAMSNWKTISAMSSRYSEGGRCLTEPRAAGLTVAFHSSVSDCRSRTFNDFERLSKLSFMVFLLKTIIIIVSTLGFLDNLQGAKDF